MRKASAPLKNSTIEKRLDKALSEPTFLDTLQELVQRMGVNYPFFESGSFLHWACDRRHVEAVEFLIQQKANLHLKNDAKLIALDSLFQQERIPQSHGKIRITDEKNKVIAHQEQIALALIHAGSAVPGTTIGKLKSKKKTLDWFQCFVYYGYPNLTKWAIENQLHLSPIPNHIEIGKDTFEIFIRGVFENKETAFGFNSLFFNLITQNQNTSPKPEETIIEKMNHSIQTLDVLLLNGLIPIDEIHEERIDEIIGEESPYSSQFNSMTRITQILKKSHLFPAESEEEQEIKRILMAKITQYRLEKTIPTAQSQKPKANPLIRKHHL